MCHMLNGLLQKNREKLQIQHFCKHMTFSYIISLTTLSVICCTDYKKSLLQVGNKSCSCELEFSAFTCKQHKCTRPKLQKSEEPRDQDQDLRTTWQHRCPNHTTSGWPHSLIRLTQVYLKYACQTVCVFVCIGLMSHKIFVADLCYRTLLLGLLLRMVASVATSCAIKVWTLIGQVVYCAACYNYLAWL